MERILALETSGTICSVALIEGERLHAEYWLEEPNVHDRLLATLVQRLLTDTGTDVTELTALAVSAGPGSFTGLRIGFAFAKGMCFGGSPKLVAVPTLEACAFAAVPIAVHLLECDIAAIVPAHDELFFVQHFTHDGVPLTDPTLETLETIEARITSRTIVCGAGAPSIRGGIHIPGVERLSARFVGRRAGALLAAGYHVGTAAGPLYVEEFVPRSQASS